MSRYEILINSILEYKSRFERAASEEEKGSSYYRALGMVKYALLINVIDYNEFSALSDDIINWEG